MICECPAAASIPTIPTFNCSENFGQIQKIAFQRLKYTEAGAPPTTGENVFAESSNSIKLKASWTAAIALTNDKKVAISPFIEAPTQDGGDPRTFGGGNDTLGGMEIIIGSEPTTFTAVLRRCPQHVIAVLKELQCEAVQGNLGVYLFSENGQIEAIKEEVSSGGGSTNVNYKPIPIRSLFVGDKIHGGFEEPDHNNLQFAFEPNYSDKLAIVTPTDFNPLNL
jgi:hypothetical protein